MQVKLGICALIWLKYVLDLRIDRAMSNEYLN